MFENVLNGYFNNSNYLLSCTTIKLMVSWTTYKFNQPSTRICSERVMLWLIAACWRTYVIAYRSIYVTAEYCFTNYYCSNLSRDLYKDRKKTILISMATRNKIKLMQYIFSDKRQWWRDFNLFWIRLVFIQRISSIIFHP